MRAGVRARTAAIREPGSGDAELGTSLMAIDLLTKTNVCDLLLMVPDSVNLLEVTEVAPRSAAAHCMSLAKPAHLLVTRATRRLPLVDEPGMLLPMPQTNRNFLMPPSHIDCSCLSSSRRRAA